MALPPSKPRNYFVPCESPHLSPFAPDGQNINEQCGALLRDGRSFVMENRESLISSDVRCDADRALFCDGQGQVVNGDSVLLIAAREMQSGGSLANATVVATTMSNMDWNWRSRVPAFTCCARMWGISTFLRKCSGWAPRWVATVRPHSFPRRRRHTGDGLLTALRIMEIMVRSGKSLADLAAI